MKTILSDISGLLFDLDGVVYIGEQVIEGAPDAVRYIKQKNIPCRFTTNTTVCSVASLHQKLKKFDLPVENKEIFSAVMAAVRYLHKMGRPSCYLLLTEDPAGDFAAFPISETEPEYVIIGDVGKYWNYELVNKVFHMVMKGAKMIALHKGRFWQTEQGLQVDMGAFVTALEYATGQKALVIGKPSPVFFQQVLEDMGLKPAQTAMVGDDIESDIGGAQAVGMKGILVKTGKFRPELIKNTKIKPDLVIDSLADLVNYL